MHFGAVPTPETKFEWAFADKHKAFKREEHTPLGFYKDVVPTRVDEMVSIINDPRNPYNKYVRACLLGFACVRSVRTARPACGVWLYRRRVRLWQLSPSQ